MRDVLRACSDPPESAVLRGMRTGPGALAPDDEGVHVLTPGFIERAKADGMVLWVWPKGASPACVNPPTDANEGGP